MPVFRHKGFFKRVVLFVFIVLVLLWGSFELNSWALKWSSKVFSDDVVTLATGSSLMAAGFNPELMPGSINVALAAEPFFVSYLKVRSLVENHANIHTVLFSYSLPELHRRKDYYLSGESAVTKELLDRLSYLNEGYNWRTLLQMKVGFLDYLEVFVRNRLFPNYALWYFVGYAQAHWTDCPLPYIGTYLPHQDIGSVDQVVQVEKQLRKYFPMDGEKPQLSEIDNAYADSLVNYCSKHNIQLYLVGFPIRHTIYAQIPKPYIDYFQEKQLEFGRKPNVTIVDLTLLDLDYYYFNDEMHLNNLGAHLVTKQVIMQMQKSALQ